MQVRAKRSEKGEGIDLFAWEQTDDGVIPAIGLKIGETRAVDADHPLSVDQLVTMTAEQAQTLANDLALAGIIVEGAEFADLPEEIRPSTASSDGLSDAWREVLRLHEQHTQEFRDIIHKLLDRK